MSSLINSIQSLFVHFYIPGLIQRPYQHYRKMNSYTIKQLLKYAISFLKRHYRNNLLKEKQYQLAHQWSSQTTIRVKLPNVSSTEPPLSIFIFKKISFCFCFIFVVPHCHILATNKNLTLGCGLSVLKYPPSKQNDLELIE